VSELCILEYGCIISALINKNAFIYRVYYSERNSFSQAANMPEKARI